MGKETELLKAIRDKDAQKVQKLLATTVKKNKDESLCWQSKDSGHKIRVELRHINVNTREPETEYTPLLIAVLNGMKDIAERLIFNCADINAKDSKGNTALHLAVFNGREDIVALLIFNEIQINAENKDGNTPLHIACETNMDQRVKIMKNLIKAGANVWLENKYSLTPLDVAAMYNKTDAVSTLLEFVPILRENRTAIIEASIRGFAKIVEMLLDYGLSCNQIDDRHGTSPLHEAIRYNRPDVVKVLLSFGASINLVNLKRESPKSMVEELSAEKAERLRKLFEQQEFESPRVPKMVERVTTPDTPERKNRLGYIKDYPELPNDITWTQNRPLFCSTCTEKNPNTQILDDNLRTFWVIPVLHDAWTILDLHSEHVITGITIFGWNSPQMLKTFQLQTSDSMEGPWTLITSFSCELLGSTDPKQAAFPQKFHGFTFKSRFIRLYVVNNHAGSYICFQGIQLHGCDCKVIYTLQECGLSLYADEFIIKALNTWKQFLDITQEQVDELVLDPEKKASLWEAVYKGREEMYPMITLKWLIPPAVTVYVDEKLQDFSVQSDPGVTEVLQLVVQGGQLTGDTNRRLVPTGEGKPSIATFSNIAIKPAGLYTILVQTVNSDIVLMAPKPTEVRPVVRSESDISSAFDEIEQMLSSMQASLPSQE